MIKRLLSWIAFTMGYCTGERIAFDIAQVTQYVNMYRERHATQPLIYDTGIGYDAAGWADYLGSLGVLQHSATDYGENVAYVHAGFCGKDTIKCYYRAVDNFYNESLLYDYKNPGYTAKTGHFTQLVWVSSQRLGVGITYSIKSEGYFIVLNFSPAGNVAGMFERNVLPLIDASPPLKTSPSPFTNPIRPSPPPPLKTSPPPSQRLRRKRPPRPNTPHQPRRPRKPPSFHG